MAKIDSADKPGRIEPIKQVKATLEKRRKRLELLSVAKLLVELQLTVLEQMAAAPAVWLQERMQFRFVVKPSHGVFTAITFTVYTYKGKYRLSYFSPAGTEDHEFDNIADLIRSVKLTCGIH